MALATAPESDRALEAERSPRSREATTTFVAVVVGLTTLILWIGPRSPRLFAYLLGIWAVNVALWKPSKWVASYAFLGAVIAGLVALNFSRLALTTRLTAVGVILICLAPSFVLPLRKGDHFPAVHVFCLVAAVYTTIGAFLSHESVLLTQFVTPADRQHGLVLYGLFLAMVVGGAAIAGGRLRARPTGQLQQAVDDEHAPDTAPTDPLRAVQLIVVGIGLGLVVRVLGVAPQLGLIIDVIYCVRLVGYLILFRMWLERRPLARWALAVLALGLLLDVLLGLGSAALFLAARTPFAVATMYVFVRRRIPWAPLVLVAAVVLSLNVQKASFRERSGGLGRLNQGNLINQGVSYATTWVDTVPHITQDQVSESASRFSYPTGDLLGYLDRRVPHEVPFWDARTYRYIPFAAIPRVIAPWKPKTLSGEEFGQRYDLLNPGTKTSTANLPLAAEAFVNYGISGVVLIGLAFGLLLGLVDRAGRRASWAFALTAAVVVAQLIGGVESDSSVIIGTAIWMGLFGYAVARWGVSGRSRGRPIT